jgi:hypothetical protein
MNQTSTNPAQDELIRVKAYEIWLGKGCPDGSAEQDWVEAERAVAALAAAEATQNAEAGSDKTTGAQQDAPETPPRPVKRPDRADVSGSSTAAAAAAAMHLGRARAAAPVEAKPQHAAPHATVEQKQEHAAERKAQPKANQKPAPMTEASTTKPAEGQEKGGLAKARSRGRAAAVNNETPRAPATPRHAASGANARPAAAQAAAAPTSAPTARQAASARNGGRRGTGTRQRKG